jgi:hypothetical protein
MVATTSSSPQLHKLNPSSLCTLLLHLLLHLLLPILQAIRCCRAMILQQKHAANRCYPVMLRCNSPVTLLAQLNCLTCYAS